MIAYFDSSALVKLFLAEPDGPVALDIWNGAELVTTSAISYLEVRAALARAVRENPPKLASTGYEDAKQAFEELWSQIYSVTVTDDLIDGASQVAERYELRAYDALQFATALSLAEEQLLFATTDHDLERAARTVGISLTRLSPST
jgi:predicted nucleic acid-binding protein